MNEDKRSKGDVIKVTSAIFATLLLPFVACICLRSWSEKMVFALVYLIILALSGWIFAITAWRISGFIHAALMLGIAGFCFYVCSSNLNTPFADNPAAGIIAAVTLVYFIGGVLAALLGTGTAYLLLGKS